MALQKKLMTFPFSKGLDEKTSEKHKQPPTLESCKNGRFDKTGQLRKRHGFTNLSKTSYDFNAGSSGTVPDCQQLAQFNDETIILDGNNAWSRTNSGTWVDKGRITGCEFQNETAFNDRYMTTGPLASAEANNYRVESWCEVDPEESTTLVYQVYSRVIDTQKDIEVVPRTRITPSAGLSVTVAHSQNNDSNYLNPNVQCVAMGGYLYTLFNDCTQQAPSLAISAAADLGSGWTKLTVSGSNYHGFLHGDVVTISGFTGGATGYNGDHVISEPIKADNSFAINVAFATIAGSGVVALKSTYSQQERTAVYASKVNTNAGVGSSLAPTVFSSLNSNPASGGYVAPAFYVHGLYPLWSIDYCNNNVRSDGAVLLRYNPVPINNASGTVGNFRVDYFEQSGGTFQEYLESGQPGYRGRNTPITETAYFQASESGHDVTKRTISHCCIRSIDSLNTIHAGFTLQDASTATTPDVSTQKYTSALAKTGSVARPTTGRVLISGSYAVKSGSEVYFVYTAQTTAAGSSSSPEPGQAANHTLLRVTVEAAGTTKNLFALAPFSTLVSDLFTYNGKTYYAATHSITRLATLTGSTGGTETRFINFLSSATIIADVGDTTGNVSPVATSGTGFGGNCAATDWPSNRLEGRTLFWGVARVKAVSSSVFRFGSSQYGSETSSSDFNTSSTVFNPSMAQLDFSPTRYLPWVEGGGALSVAGGFLWDYGGDVFKENGFFTYPQITATAAATSGGQMSDGNNYKYRAIYEWTSASGAVHRSYPSDDVVINLSGGGSAQKVTVSLYKPAFSYKRLDNGLSNIKIVLYRTEAGSSVFYRVGSADVSMVYADVGDATLDIVDDQIPSSGRVLTSSEQLYSSGEPGDQFGNIMPPSCTDIAIHKDRAFVSVVDGSVWYSKKFVPGIPAEFSEFQVIPIENYTGKISCIGSVRDYLIAVTQDSAYLIGGDGPNGAGVGGAFTSPTVFSRDAGALKGCCRINTPVGFLYEAKGGLYQITTSLQTKWIGAPVEDTVDTYGLQHAVVNDSEGEVYFGLDNDEAGTLVYNYIFNQWSRWEISHAAYDGDITPKGMIILDGKLNQGLPGGTVIQQGAGYRDVGASTYDYSLEVTTAWISAEQFLKMGRFYNILLSGTFVNDHNLTMQLYANYDDSLTETNTKAITSSNGTPYILRHHVKYQKARSIKIKFSETSTASPFEGYRIDGFAIEYGSPAGTFALGTTRTV